MFSDQSETASSHFLNIPSPEQGASAATRSKKAGYIFASSDVSREVTATFRKPSRSTFPTSIFARFPTYSFERTAPPSPTAAESCEVLPPGAAHRSATRHPSSIFTAATGHIAPGSCIYIIPA